MDPEWSPAADALAFRARTLSGEHVRVVTLDGRPIADVALPSVTLRANRADHNADLGIEAVAAIDGGGNRARHNGDPRQCTGVSCSGGSPSRKGRP